MPGQGFGQSVTPAGGPTGGGASSPLYEILVVCTGNLCRSPAAELLLQHHLDTAAPGAFHVTSAGTGAVVGAPIHELTVPALAQLGLDVDQHVARQLAFELVAPADLVLTATRRHRVDVADLLPAALPRLFTVLEFARLAPLAARDKPEADPRELVDNARRLRSAAPSDHPGDDDLPDPISGGLEDHDRSVRAIDEAARTIAAAMAGHQPTAQDR